jgi:transcriptional regulator with XRE-family HTH domain
MQTLTLEKPGMEKPLIATRVKALREKAGISQMELAIRSGLSLSMIAQVEQGVKPDPRMSTVQALAKALGVDCTALVEDGGSGKKARRPRGK